MPRKYTIKPHIHWNTFDKRTGGQKPVGKVDWYVGEEFYKFPNLFLKGYEHFRKVINVHNRRWPYQQWPYLTLREFLDRAKAIQQRRWREKNWKPSTDTVKSIIDTNRQKAQRKKKQLYYNWLASRFGTSAREHNTQFSYNQWREWQDRRLNARLKLAAKQGFKKMLVNKAKKPSC